MTILLVDEPLRIDQQLAARVHGRGIGDAAFYRAPAVCCCFDGHLAIDLDVSSADARLETIQRDSSIGSNLRFIVCSAQNSSRRILPIEVCEVIILSPGYFNRKLKAVALRMANHPAVCHQPQPVVSIGCCDQRDSSFIKCAQRHLVGNKGQGVIEIRHLSIDRTPVWDGVLITRQFHTCHRTFHRICQCQRGREVQREGCGKHPGEEFLPSSLHCKSLLFSTNFVAGKKLHGSLLGYRGALVFAINPGLVFG